MKRVLSIAFIVAYLGTLNFGILCHMLGYATASHPLMYFIVWDMFCGWSAYDARAYVVGEGESRTFYDLSTPPWGEFHPWGTLGRQHYDSLNNHTGRIGLNVLRHTQHEPITRLYVIEETWAKKYNIPEKVWQARYDEPRNVRKYYRVRGILLPDGTVTQVSVPWLQYQALNMLGDNPRLRVQASTSRSLFMMDHEQPGRDMLIGPGIGRGYLPSTGVEVRAPLGD